MHRFFLILILICSQTVFSQDLSLYEKHWFSATDSRLPYRLLYPASFDSSTKYPVVVFLHGAGARGNNNESQLEIGARFFLRPENREKFPAIILFPQCSEIAVWADFKNEVDPITGLARNWQFPFNRKPTFPMAGVIELLDSMIKLPFVDKTKIYVGGLSQGGMGVFDIVARRPDLIAAAFPICGGGKISTAKKFAGKVAMWIFHGEKDDVVPTHFSRDFYKALQKERSDVRYTEYPGVNHVSWGYAFAEPDLLPWLFTKKKNDP